MSTVSFPQEDNRQPISVTEVTRYRSDFPMLCSEEGGKRLVYLDNAATSQKPRCVIEAETGFYERYNANVHRGVYRTSEQATFAYEAARAKVQRFLGALLPCEIVFTRGATEAINLVAQTFGRQHVGPGDEVLVTVMEHHSNLVPWQMLCEEKGATLHAIRIHDDGDLSIDTLDRMISSKTRLLAIAHVSNVLGTVNPIAEIAEIAHGRGIPILVDGAQSAPHLPVDVTALNCDFFVCSGHKMLGPTGIGILYGRGALLDAMPPWQGGGEMIRSVTFEKTTYADPPARFEAGTPNIAGAIGLGTAIDYLSEIGMGRIAVREQELVVHTLEALKSVPGIHVLGTPRDRGGVVSFVMECAHPHDIAQVLDDEGIAIRAGHHCAQPLMERLGVTATARISPSFYNTNEEIDALAKALLRVREIFA